MLHDTTSSLKRCGAASAIAAAILATSALAPTGGDGLANADRLFGAAPAQAAEIRYKGWNKRDVLLSTHERNVASSGIGGASWVCGIGLDRGFASNIGGVVRWVPCVSAVSVCSVKAKLAGRNAGITFTFLPPNFWCWTY